MQKILNNNAFPNRQGHKPKFIILHSTAGGTSAVAIANYFKSTEGGNNPVSSHYVVGTDGQVIMCVPEADGAWCNGALTQGHDAFWDESINPNNLTVTIEHCKPDYQNAAPLTDAQKAASFSLIADICKRNNIPMHAANADGGITGHFSLDPVSRARCPGEFPWNELFSYLSQPQGATDMLQITDPFAATHFTAASDTAWHCKSTGMDLHDAILAYYRQTGGAFRLPRSNEIYGVIAGCSYQVFEAGILVYDPQGKYDKPGFAPCYAMHLDANTPGLQHLMHLANVTTPVQPPTLNLDDAASTLRSLASAGDAIKAAAQKVLGDIGKG